MYGKLFVQMFDGSLPENWRALVTFQQMIVLASPDGVVDMTPKAIAARTGIPMEIIEQGILELEKPDLLSRTPERDGRRIERIDENRPWGWLIVNYLKFRKLASTDEKRAADRSRIAAKRAAESTGVRGESRDVASRRDMSQPVENVAQGEEDEDREGRTTHAPVGRAARFAPEFSSEFLEFWNLYPRKAKKSDAYHAWKSISPDQILRDVIHAAIKQQAESNDWTREDGRFIPFPATWLREARWQDEAKPPHDDMACLIQSFTSKYGAHDLAASKQGAS